MILLACLLQSTICLCTQAQNYIIDWHTVNGGGGTSTGGVFAVSGTIGQPDGGLVMTGGNYTLTGGFWSLISVIQTPGAPTLYVTQANGVVTVYWKKPAVGWELQRTATLTGSPAPWQRVPAEEYQSNATDISITIPAPAGQWFFRLHKP